MTLNEQEFNYMAQLYASMGSNMEETTVMQYKGAKNTEEYEKILQEDAEKACLNNMAFQDLAAKAGITVTDEMYENFKTENEVTEEIEEAYGKPYIIQQYIMPDLVRDYIKEHVTVE
jgi:archaellin